MHDLSHRLPSQLHRKVGDSIVRRIGRTSRHSRFSKFRKSGRTRRRRWSMALSSLSISLSFDRYTQDVYVLLHSRRQSSITTSDHSPFLRRTMRSGSSSGMQTRLCAVLSPGAVSCVSSRSAGGLSLWEEDSRRSLFSYQLAQGWRRTGKRGVDELSRGVWKDAGMWIASLREGMSFW